MERCPECHESFPTWVQVQGHRGGKHGKRRSRLALVEERIERVEEVLKSKGIRV